MHRFATKRFFGPLSARAVSAGLALCLSASLSLLSGCLSRSLTSIYVQPAAGNTTIAPGVQAQFQAFGVYTEGGHASETENITSQVTWSAVIPTVASVNSSGLVTGVAPGTTSIIATIKGAYGQLSASSDVVVSSPSGGSGATTRTLTSVSIVPASQTLTAQGESAQFLAIGTYNTSPTSENLTSSASWSSSAPSVATVDTTLSGTPGRVTAVGAGTTTITVLATSPDGSIVQGSATVNVNIPTTSTTPARTLTAITVSPGSQTLTAAGQTAQFIAIGSYNESPLTSDLSSTATWESSDTSIATVSSGGVVQAVSPGSVTITAIGTAADGSIITGSAVVNVESSLPANRTLTGLEIIPASQSTTTTGETAQFLAIGTYSAAPLTADLTNQATWLSSDVAVATVNNAGLATTVGTNAGEETTITALVTDPSNGDVLAASGTLQVVAPGGGVGPGSSTLPTLTVYGAGSGSGSVTSSPGAISCSYTGPANGAGAGSQPTAQCSGSFPVGTTVTLTETPATGSVFDGWSSNCAPVATSPTDPTTGQHTACTITVNTNDTVGAIFDPQ